MKAFGKDGCVHSVAVSFAPINTLVFIILLALNSCLAFLSQIALTLLNCLHVYSTAYTSFDLHNPVLRVQMRQLKVRDNFPRVYAASDRTCQGWNSGWNTDILSADAVLKLLVAAYSEATVLLLHPKAGQPRDLRTITGLHPPRCVSICFVIFTRKLSNATFRYNSQFVETEDIKKHSEAHMWKQSTNTSQ